MRTVATIEGKTFADRLERAIRDIDFKENLRVWKSVLLQLEPGTLTIGVRQSDTCVRYPMNAVASETINLGLGKPRQLFKWLKAMKLKSGSKVDICVESVKDSDTICYILFSRENRSVKLPVIPEEEFPMFEGREYSSQKWKKLGQLPVSAIKTWGPILASTISTDVTRPYLNGVGFQDGYFGSTDGHRMNYLDGKAIGAKIGKDTKFLVPGIVWSRLVQECKKLKADGMIQMYRDNNVHGDLIEFQMDDHTRVFKNAELRLPPYKSVLPSYQDRAKWTPDRAEFMQLASEVNALRSGVNSSKIMHLRLNNKGYHVRYDDPGEEINFEGYIPGNVESRDDRAPAGEVGLSCSYVSDALVPFENPEVYIGGPLDGVVFTEQDSPLYHVLMPSRI